MSDSATNSTTSNLDTLLAPLWSKQTSSPKSTEDARVQGMNQSAYAYNNAMAHPQPRYHGEDPPYPIEVSSNEKQQSNKQQNVAKRNHHSLIRGCTANAPKLPSVRDNSSADLNYVQSKNGHAVESYFRDQRFSGALDESIDILIPDYDACSVQQYLNQA